MLNPNHSVMTLLADFPHDHCLSLFKSLIKERTCSNFFQKLLSSKLCETAQYSVKTFISNFMMELQTLFPCFNTSLTLKNQIKFCFTFSGLCLPINRLFLPLQVSFMQQRKHYCIYTQSTFTLCILLRCICNIHRDSCLSCLWSFLV